MAQKVTRHLVDDLDGGDADCTVTFSLDGAEYEIDLSEENAEKLRESLGVYIECARRVGGRARRGRAQQKQPEVAITTLNGDADQLAQIRAWARKAGYRVADKGRIARKVMDAFEAQAGRRAS